MPMTSQEMIKLLLKTVLLLSARTAPMLPLQRHKKRSGTGNSETSWLKITNINKENQNEKTFLSGTFS